MSKVILAAPPKSNGGRKEPKDPLATLRRAKKKEEPAYTEAERNAPLQRCIDCASWKSKGEQEHRDYIDISSGHCQHCGMQTPPMHSCQAWRNHRGDTMAKPADAPFWNNH